MPVPDPQAALARELGTAIQESLQSFTTEHEQLVRRACTVPANVETLDLVVVCAFLGHTIERLLSSNSRQRIEGLVRITLDRLENAQTGPGSILS